MSPVVPRLPTISMVPAARAALSTLVVAATLAACGSPSPPHPPSPPPPAAAVAERPPLQVAVEPGGPDDPTARDPFDPHRDPDPFHRDPRPPEPPERDACAPAITRSRLAECFLVVPRGFDATGSPLAAQSAFDGSTCIIWSSGGFAPQSITVDLGEVLPLDGIILTPEMTPNGPVRHRIELADTAAPGAFQTAHRIEAPMQTGVPVELPFPRRERARFVRIVTDASPSWVAWREIRLLRCGRP